MPVVPEIGRCMGRIDAGGLHIAKHEVCKCRACVGAVEAERPARRSCLLKRNIAASDFRAKLQVMLSMLPGHRVLEFEDLIRTVTRANLPLQIVHTKGSIRAADSDGWRAVLGRQARN